MYGSSQAVQINSVSRSTVLMWSIYSMSSFSISEVLFHFWKYESMSARGFFLWQHPQMRAVPAERCLSTLIHVSLYDFSIPSMISVQCSCEYQALTIIKAFTFKLANEVECSTLITPAPLSSLPALRDRKDGGKGGYFSLDKRGRKGSWNFSTPFHVWKRRCSDWFIKPQP